MKIVLGVTGSVAGKLTPKMASALIEAGHEVQIVSTAPGLYFLPEGVGDELRVNSLKGPIDVPLFRDKHEWPIGGYHKDDPVRHIEFRTWADLLLIAPLSANTLAKLANGIADNFLCCIARAWPKDKPFVVVPAMNTEMWIDPITGVQIGSLGCRFKKLKVVEPVEAALACGETGIGAMARIEAIVKEVDSFK
jgi:phosphopantothenoylcysteine synthetase/decarboxylase